MLEEGKERENEWRGKRDSVEKVWREWSGMKKVERVGKVRKRREEEWVGRREGGEERKDVILLKKCTSLWNGYLFILKNMSTFSLCAARATEGP